jgi:hypothetical protein
MSVQVFFAWYDFWVGAYYDRDTRALYICPLPMLVIRIGAPPEEERILGGHAVGFDGCPACTIGEGRSCRQCDYDCCSDCTFDSETTFSDLPDGAGTVGIRHWNEVCNCEGHICS